MIERYELKKQSGGWAVVDIWTGRPVVIADRRQTALDLPQAVELAALLNDHARRGNRIVLQ